MMLRYLGRVGTSAQHLNLLKCSCAVLPSQIISDRSVTVCTPPSRSYSYYKSNVEESPEKYTAYEKSYEEWKFVEKLIPMTHVAAAPTLEPGQEMPSGWKAPNPSMDYSYLIRRTKNHMVPVYVKIMDRGQVRFTYIKKVEGNIWQLEKDIGRYLQNYQKDISRMVIVTRTHELCRHVIIKGDFGDVVKQWVLDKGF